MKSDKCYKRVDVYFISLLMNVVSSGDSVSITATPLESTEVVVDGQEVKTVYSLISFANDTGV